MPYDVTYIEYLTETKKKKNGELIDAEKRFVVAKLWEWSGRGGEMVDCISFQL